VSRFFKTLGISCGAFFLAISVASAQAARTPWGDPDLQGAYTNSDESLIPMERPDTLKGKALSEVTSDELEKLNEERNEARVEADKQRWELRSPLHWFENHNPKNSRAWLVVDPADGKIPPITAEAKARASARAQARKGRGEADSYEDRSLYDRCITRGLPGSMMPAIYGNSYEIVQGPGFVAIQYEMVNELRVIPLDGRPHLSSTIRNYMGDARGHFEGDTLVVETTNFHEDHRASVRVRVPRGQLRDAQYPQHRERRGEGRRALGTWISRDHCSSSSVTPPFATARRISSRQFSTATTCWPSCLRVQASPWGFSSRPFSCPARRWSSPRSSR
jgi:hypothetical protein